jgi:hypothetical protein
MWKCQGLLICPVLAADLRQPGGSLSGELGRWLGRGLPNLVDLRADHSIAKPPNGPALLAAKLPYRQRMGRPSTQKRRADPNAATLANPGSGNARSRTSHAGARCPLPVLPQEPQTPYRPANRTISLPDETEPSPSDSERQLHLRARGHARSGCGTAFSGPDLAISSELLELQDWR